MIKYKFKLEAVLKIRKFAEEKCRNELGQLYVEKNKIEEKIKFQKNEIQKFYIEQEEQLALGIKAKALTVFPAMVGGKQKLIKQYENDLVRMAQFIKIKNDELIQKKAELKMIENIQEKELAKFKYNLNRKTTLEIEEQQMFWRESMKIHEGET